MKLPFKFMPPIVWLVRLLVGAYPRWVGSAPSANQRIYFANHTSHMDTVVLWAALPPSLRANTRPVAARDYWGGGGIRTQIARDELNVVMIDRARDDPDADPLDPLRSNPNKSREGVLIGGLAAALLGTGLWWMTPFTWWPAALMSTAIVVAGFMGGLVLASVKHSLGAREWYEGVQLSRGALDRLDALSFAAPVFFHLTWYFFAA